jgi:hypothetical protein
VLDATILTNRQSSPVKSPSVRPPAPFCS